MAVERIYYEEIKELQSKVDKLKSTLGELEHLEYHLKKRDDGLWYVMGINKTGGCEFSTWWGYGDQIPAVDGFQRIFNYPVWDPESMRDYPYKTDSRKGSA